MTDVHSKEIRSKNMAAIKSKNTKPELLIENILKNSGVKFTAQDKSLPGKPDFVIPDYRAVIFVHGCFWHGHDCHLFKWPKSRTEFWKKKITGNIERDRKNIKTLKSEGWWVLEIWECSLKGRNKMPFDVLVSKIENWILYEMKSKSFAEIINNKLKNKIGNSSECK